MLFACAAPAQSPSTCIQLSFSGEANNGKNYSRQFSPSLQFKLQALDDTGWAFNIITTDTQPSDIDFVYPVTPPYRGRNAQQINTGWGTLAQEAARKGSVDFEFLLNSVDAARAMELLESVLWPGEQDSNKALNEISSLPHGWGTFEITDSQFTPGTPVPGFSNCEENKCGSIQWVRFRVTLTVPADFPASSDVHPLTTSCPEQQK